MGQTNICIDDLLIVKTRGVLICNDTLDPDLSRSVAFIQPEYREFTQVMIKGPGR